MTEQAESVVAHSVRRIALVANALRARTYLEIGVGQGLTFGAVAISERTGVDPQFRFDTSTVIDAHTHLEEMTSDIFFSTLPPSEKFDIIFIDGLHIFEQTYRDLCNSLLHSHDATVVLLDDTKPSDVFSAMRDQGKAVARRRQAGGTSTSWHGDVFKAVFAIHDFHPGLKYRTVFGSGNPQTLVWRSNSDWRKPRYDSLEAISRLDYFDLLNNINILRPASEDAAIAECLADLGVAASFKLMNE